MGNNPVNAVDPSGNSACWDEHKGDAECKEVIPTANGLVHRPKKPKGEPYPGFSGEINENNFIYFYQTGWSNFWMGFDILTNPYATIEQRLMAEAYILFWSGAHYAAAAGTAVLGVAAFEVVTGIGMTCAVNNSCTQSVSSIVKQTAETVSNNLGGVLKEAQGAGWRITLPEAASGKDIIIRIMEFSKRIPVPYYRVVVDNRGALDALGNISSSKEATHFLLNLSNINQSIDQIYFLVNGVITK